MIDECKKHGMKPVCDHKNYCKNDGNAIYIGQDHHVAHRGHRYNNGYFPSGWSEIKKHFDNMCMYTNNHGGHAKALCQNGGGHAWSTPAQNNKFMCAGPTATSLSFHFPQHCLRCAPGFQHFKKPGKQYGPCANCHQSCSKCVEQDAHSCKKCAKHDDGAVTTNMMLKPPSTLIVCGRLVLELQAGWQVHQGTTFKHRRVL